MKIKITTILMTTLMVGLGEVQATIVDISVATDKATYLLDEEITVFIIAYNPSADPVMLAFPTTKQSSYLMDDVYNWKDHHGAYPVSTKQEIGPYASHTWTLIHGSDEMGTYTPSIGTHTIVGEVIGYGHSTANTFEAVPEPATVLLFGLGGLALRRC